MPPLAKKPSTVVNIAVAGLGRIGQIHVTNLLALRHVRILAVYDPNPKAQEWLRDLFPDENVIQCTSFEDLIAVPQVHLVWIATPTSQHAAQSIAAIKAGKHVFCEKPLSTCVEEARQILEIASLHPEQVVLCGFSRRFDHSYTAAYEAIAAGTIGRAHLIHSRTLDLSMLLPSPNGGDKVVNSDVNFFYQYARSSGGIFKDCLIHDIDLALYLFAAGREDQTLPVPRRVWATGSIEVYAGLEELGDVDNAVGTVEFWSGEIATLHGSRTMAHGHDTGSEIYGIKGKLAINGTPRYDCLEVLTEAGQVTPLQQSWWQRFSSAFVTEAQEVVDAVRLRVEERSIPAAAASSAHATTMMMMTATTATATASATTCENGHATDVPNDDDAADERTSTASNVIATAPSAARRPIPSPPRNLTLESSVRVLEIADALTRSLREGREVRFDQQGNVVDDDRHYHHHHQHHHHHLENADRVHSSAAVGPTVPIAEIRRAPEPPTSAHEERFSDVQPKDAALVVGGSEEYGTTGSVLEGLSSARCHLEDGGGGN